MNCASPAAVVTGMRRVRSGLYLFQQIRPPPYRILHQRPSSNMAAAVNKDFHTFEKTRFEALLNRRFFYAPAFEIYGGTFRIINKSIYSHR